MPKRKGLSKKVRFEVFKRDSFTRQHCGGKSPENILHVDYWSWECEIRRSINELQEEADEQ